MKGKYATKEKTPIILLKNKEINIAIRQIIEDFIQQML